MTHRTKAFINAQFEAGDRPTDQTFIDLHDSIVFIGGTNNNVLGSNTSIGGTVSVGQTLLASSSIITDNSMFGKAQGAETLANPLQVYGDENETIVLVSGSSSDILFEGISGNATSSIKLSDNLTNVRFGTHTNKGFFEIHGVEAITFQTGSTAGDKTSITSFKSGSVGIGTTSPSTLFDVEGSENTLARFKSTDDGPSYIKIDTSAANTNSDSAVLIAENNTIKGSIGYDAGNDTMVLLYATSTAGTTGINIASDGKVGIGTASPINALDVRGDVSIGATPTIKLFDDNDVSSSPTAQFASDTLLATSGSFNINIDSDNSGTNAKFSIRSNSNTTSGLEVFSVTEVGAVSASSFVGDGSALTGISGFTSTNSGDNRILTSINATSANAEANLTFDGEILTHTLGSGDTQNDGIKVLSPANDGKLQLLNNSSVSDQFGPIIEGDASSGLTGATLPGLIIQGRPAQDNISNPCIVLRGIDAADNSAAEASPILRIANFSDHKFQMSHDGSTYIGDPIANAPQLVGGFSLQIRGGSGTIAGSAGGSGALSGSSFLVGSVASGIGIDSNEIYRNGGSLSIGTIDNSDIIYFQNGGEKVRFKSDGKVGIGTSSPQAGLHIDISGAPQLLLDGGGASTGDIVVPTGEILEIGHWDNSSTTFTDRFNIQSDGSIGIGVVSPSYFFDVQTTEDTIAHFKSTDAGPSYIRINTSAADDDTHSGIIYQENGSNKVFSGYSATNDTAVLLYDTGPNSIKGINIDSDGKVGIGTIDPNTQKLHIFDDSTVDIGDNSNKGQLTLENDGDGDVGITYLLTGVQRWSTYVNNSNNDDFVIECTSTNTRGLIIETDGDVSVGKDLDITGTLSLGDGSIVFDTVGTFGPEIRFVGQTDAGFIGHEIGGTDITTFRIGTRDNENEPIVFSQQSTDAVIDERMRIDSGGDVIVANSLIIGLTGNQDGVDGIDDLTNGEITTSSTHPDAGAAALSPVGGKAALVIKSKYQGGDIASEGTEGNPQDGFAGGGIRLVDNDTPQYWDNAYINNTLVWSFRQTDQNATVQFKADADSSEQTIAFTGQHPCRPVNDISSYTPKVGYIVVASGEYHNGKFSSNVTSTTEPTINEALPKVVLSSTEKDKKVFGVVSLVEDSNSIREVTHGKITSVLAPAKQAAGDERLWINSLGEGAIMVSNYNGNIENGDYITTSPIEGIGMKQDDDLLHNYTVAKITQDEDFSVGTTNITHNGQIYKIKLVGCTYHCG